ncbi:MAG: uroporphyrinogen-III synthase, partial [Saprospiraceae bacterium]|nr:uroporphyrinogen-III synthase [Saprospiraceae bacterium]
MPKMKESYKKIKTILISQPKPERSPYFDIEKKWGIKVDWRPFIHVEPVTEKEFRRNRLRPDEFSAVIFTSKNSIEHFFRMCEEMRVKMSQQTKYFCLTEAIANYLQKFIVYRKRKVFVGVRKIKDLEASFEKHKENERFLLPCSNLGAKDVVKYLEEKEINFKEAMMYRTVS